MKLEQEYLKEKKRKFNEVLLRYTRLILSNPSGKITIEAVEYQKSRFLKEKSRLFQQKIQPEETYHMIDKFDGAIKALDGSPHNFEEKFKIAKNLILKQYFEHDYLPKVQQFFSQDSEVIVKKMARYNAYLEIAQIFSLPFQSIVKKIKKGKPVISDNPVIDSESHTAFRNLFITDKAYSIASKTIRENLLDEYFLWKGIKGESQEMPVLVEFLKDHHYISYKLITPTVEIFCKRYDFIISDRAKRTLGKGKDEIYKYFQSIFPVLDK